MFEISVGAISAFALITLITPLPLPPPPRRHSHKAASPDSGYIGSEKENMARQN